MNIFHCALAAAVAVVGFMAIVPTVEAQVSIRHRSRTRMPLRVLRTTLLTPVLPRLLRPEWFGGGASSVLARGFTGPASFRGHVDKTFDVSAVIEARYRTVAIALSRQSVSIGLTISEEMKCGMGAAT